jgi:hypothetical protein
MEDGETVPPSRKASVSILPMLPVPIIPIFIALSLLQKQALSYNDMYQKHIYSKKKGLILNGSMDKNT